MERSNWWLHVALQRRMLKGKDTANAQIDWYTINKSLDVTSQSLENEAAPHLDTALELKV